MKICIGIIVNTLDDKVSLIDFLINARRFNRKIDEVIIVYSKTIDKGYLENVMTFTNVKLLHIEQLDHLKQSLLKRGASPLDVDVFLNMNDYDKTGLITYSKKRNLVLLQALVDDQDVVFFIDSDVHPCVLYHAKEAEEVDFIGEHLTYLKMKDIAITTSDYSGYFILPPMDFEGMDAYLEGIQKEGTIPYMKSSENHHCLKLGLSSKQREPFFTHKMLGGNAAMKTAHLHRMPPFFSYYYKVGDTYYLTRGEDTTMGLFFESSPLRMIDIDLKIVHDTYGDYPIEPDLKRNPAIQNRLFYASMGWIGRNPFLNYKLGKDYKALAEYQKSKLKKGAKLLATYLEDERFLLLPDAVDAAVKNLDEMLMRHDILVESWYSLTNQLKGE